ncbi:MAG: bifunctional lysylphosphatidylglycerol flippase/synthetase MprF [Halothiobacillaceae bacterium]
MSQTHSSRSQDAAPEQLIKPTKGFLARLRRLFSAKWLMPTITLLMFVLAISAIYHMLREVSPQALLEGIRAIPLGSIALSVLFMALSFVFMIGYDASALFYLKKRLPWRTVALGAFTGYAFSNTVGMALVSGASIRYRIYVEAGLDGMDIAKIAAFCALAFGIGAHVVAAAGLALHPELLADRLNVSVDILRGVGLFGLALAAGVLLWLVPKPRHITLWKWQVDMPGWRLSLTQLAITVFDILFSVACLYALLPADSVPFGTLVLVFVLAAALGVASHVPAGLGVFEAVMIAALGDHVPMAQLTVALVLFRIIYYLLPLSLAMLLLVWREVRLARGRAVSNLVDEPPPLPKRGVLRARVGALGDWGARLVPLAAAGLMFIAGLAMLASAALPGVPERLALLDEALPWMLVEVSHVLAALVGLSLLFLARGLQRRLNGAYVLSIGMLLLGIVLNLIKGFDYEEATVLGTVAVVLFLSRKEFYRRTRLLDSSFSAGWLAAVFAALVGMLALSFFAFKDVAYSPMLWWQFGLDQEAARSLRATLGVGIGVALLGLMVLLRPPLRVPDTPYAAVLAHAQAIVLEQDCASANLALLGDKSIMLNEEGDAFLMFARQGSSYIALGDVVSTPTAASDAAEELAWSFRELVSREGGRIAFYQVRAEFLPLYLDMGLTPLKIGEEAVVKLQGFELKGKKQEANRYVVNRGERVGLAFEYLPASRWDEVFDEVKAVSDAWLALRKAREKRFSLGLFAADYVRRFDVALLRYEGRIVAFVTVLRTATQVEAMTDVMRHLPNAPRDAVRFLLLKLMLHLKAEGVQRFSLAMAPLSGLEGHRYAPVWQRIGAAIYQYGGAYYNFSGVRFFKEQFYPEWEPRYLVTQGGLDPAIILADVAILIGGGVRGVLGK